MELTTTKGRSLHVPIVSLMDFGKDAAADDEIAQLWGTALSEFGFALVDNTAVDSAAAAQCFGCAASL